MCKYCDNQKNEPLIKDEQGNEYHQSCQEQVDADYAEWQWEREQEFFNSLEYGEIEFIQQQDRE
jgi:hypothetical protein